jgi:hypothetical protein
MFSWLQFISHVIWQVKEDVAKLKSLNTSVASKRIQSASSLFKDIIRAADKRRSSEMFIRIIWKSLFKLNRLMNN